MDRSTSQEIDFDALHELASSDPDGFEARRHQMIEQLIGSAPEHQRRRLRGLQWQVDMERRRASNPLSACLSLSRMMWESVAGEGGLLEAINGLPEGQGARLQPPPSSAKARVLSFPERH